MFKKPSVFNRIGMNFGTIVLQVNIEYATIGGGEFLM